MAEQGSCSGKANPGGHGCLLPAAGRASGLSSPPEARGAARSLERAGEGGRASCPGELPLLSWHKGEGESPSGPAGLAVKPDKRKDSRPEGM